MITLTENLKEKNMKTLDLIGLVLIVVGGLNWGLVGLAKFDLVAALLGGPEAALARLVYTLVGLAALLRILRWKGAPTLAARRV
jgi:uncharacterized membrane protein YuzA (DUF378 family)